MNELINVHINLLISEFVDCIYKINYGFYYWISLQLLTSEDFNLKSTVIDMTAFCGTGRV